MAFDMNDTAEGASMRRRGDIAQKPPVDAIHNLGDRGSLRAAISDLKAILRAATAAAQADKRRKAQ